VEERRSAVASGKTVEDAIKNGLTMLNVRRDQVDVEIISEGSRGVLGFGAENARVRLLVKPAPAQKPPAPERVSPAAPAPEPARVAPAPAKVPAAPAPSPAPATQAAAPASPARAPAPAQASQAAVPASPARAPAPAPAPEAHKPSAEQAGREILSDLLKLMGVHANIEVQPGDALADEGQPPPPVLNLTGDDLGILIGRRGETLHALQYLLRLMASHRLKHWTNLVVDVENYRVRRRQALESLANRVAEEVARSGRSQALEPMPPDERRVVHVTLRHHPKVATQSVGEGERRKVTIVPKK
jgi:spoIIIJ-associated protein